MRDFVIEISNYSKSLKPDFAVIPQNGIEIITRTGNIDDPVEYLFAKNIDGWGIEDLNYGYEKDNIATSLEDQKYIISYLNKVKSLGKKVMVTDYCWTRSFMNNSYYLNNRKGYISFAADKRSLTNVPNYPGKAFNENTANITNLSQAKNFLYLINPENFGNKSAFISALAKTNYDLILIDTFFQKTSLTKDDVKILKTKANKGKRLVISYMSIGEAENYRFYWKANWKVGNPSFIQAENSLWKGNYKVKYWDPNWKKIIYGNQSSYLKRIIDLDFDGVYLDIIDGFNYFEQN